MISEDQGFDIVWVTSDVITGGTETKVWRIDRPNVRERDDTFKKNITFRKGDSISFNAGGACRLVAWAGHGRITRRPRDLIMGFGIAVQLKLRESSQVRCASRG